MIAFLYFALNLASWSLCLLNFIFMKSDTASSLVKGVMCMLCILPVHACSVFKAVVGSVILLLLTMLHPVLWPNHKHFWVACVATLEQKHPSLACVCRYCNEMTFLGSLNVQLFQVCQLLMVGYVPDLTVWSTQLKICLLSSCFYPMCKILYCSNCMACVAVIIWHVLQQSYGTCCSNHTACVAVIVWHVLQ